MTEGRSFCYFRYPAFPLNIAHTLSSLISFPLCSLLFFFFFFTQYRAYLFWREEPENQAQRPGREPRLKLKKQQL